VFVCVCVCVCVCVRVCVCVVVVVVGWRDISEVTTPDVTFLGALISESMPTGWGNIPSLGVHILASSLPCPQLCSQWLARPLPLTWREPDKRWLSKDLVATVELPSVDCQFSGWEYTFTKIQRIELRLSTKIQALFPGANVLFLVRTYEC
jgi:hypothetical protein